MIEGQSSKFKCQGTVDSKLGDVFLARWSDEAAQYERMTTQRVTRGQRRVDRCQSRVQASFDLTLGLFDNSTKILCQTVAGENQSQPYNVVVIPGTMVKAF